MAMTAESLQQRRIATSIARTNFVRRTSTAIPATGSSGHREWLHFSVTAPNGLTLIVNLSLTDDMRPVSRGMTLEQRRPERGRLVVLVHDANVASWAGGAEEIDPGQIEARAGSIFLRLGTSQIEFDRGRFRVSGALRDRSVEFDVELSPTSFPSLASNVSLGPSEDPIHWVVVPRLVVRRGSVSVAGVVTSLDGALAYHDHNWGHFSHRDFAWQWGHGFPRIADANKNPFSVVFTRLLNGTRSDVFMQALLLWRGCRQERVFREDEIQVHSEGFLRRPAFTVPKIGRLLAGGRTNDIPRHFFFVARGHGDELRGEVVTNDVAEIVVPNDHDLETTLIREVVSRIHVAGHVRGERVAIDDGVAVFEWIGRPA